MCKQKYVQSLFSVENSQYLFTILFYTTRIKKAYALR